MASQTGHIVRIETHDGSASVGVTLHGACVYSWKVKGVERLFTSTKSPLEGPAPVRGYVGLPQGPPPKEAPFDKLSQHGFARKSAWIYEGAMTGLGTDAAGLRFSLSPSDEIKEIFQPEFQLIYEVVISNAGSLSCVLTVKNPSPSDKFRFQALFHNYFQLPNGTSLADVKIEGLQALQYLDKPDGAKRKKETGTVTFAGEVDRVYLDAPTKATISGSQGHFLEVAKEGFSDFVTWNPAEEKGNAFKDLQKDGWKEYICLEPGYCQDFVELAPGASHVCKQVLQVQ